MNKLSNSKLNSVPVNVFAGLGILAILAFAFLGLPTFARADVGGTYTPYNSTQPNPVSGREGYNSYYEPVAAPIPITHTSGSNVNTTSTENQGEVRGASTTNTSTTTTTTKKEDSNLAANAIFGNSNGFMPSGLLQWIFFAILILLIVILVRKILGADKKYHSTPLKHA